MRRKKNAPIFRIRYLKIGYELQSQAIYTYEEVSLRSYRVIINTKNKVWCIKNLLNNNIVMSGTYVNLTHIKRKCKTLLMRLGCKLFTEDRGGLEVALKKQKEKESEK
jgi:hypothetical protein